MKSSPTDFGIEIPQEQIDRDLFPGEEGMIQLFYGPIRNGKSTFTARSMHEDLMVGRSVYSNLNLDLSNESFDQREQLSLSLENLIFGKKIYYRFLKSNFHYFNPNTGFLYCDGVETKVFDPSIPGDLVRWLNTLTDCVIYYDEGHWLLNSYEGTKQDLEKMRFITETGHVNRKIVIISQRTQSIHVNARANVNQFFRCTKRNYLFGLFMRLQVEEFQAMKGSDVDETVEPVSVQVYWSNQRYWRLFNTHFLRQGRPRSQELHFKAYELSRNTSFALVLWHLFARKGRARVKAERDPAGNGQEPIQPVFKSSSPISTIKKGTFDIPLHDTAPHP